MLTAGAPLPLSIPDLIIAVVANANDKVVFTKDSDFRLIQRGLPVTLLEWPPT